MNDEPGAGAEITLAPAEFVALINQTLDYAYPHVTITGELANFRVSKGRWVYFDLKDDEATVHFFGTVYMLPGPLEDGMLLAVQGNPRLHPQYGFSVNVLRMRPVGEGSIKKAAALLEKKLAAEGLFDPARKRALPYPPRRIGLVTSGESAAYRDFIKVLGARWGGLDITLIDVQVQGEAAPAQITAAIAQCNQLPDPPDVVVVTRGGGSAEDLAAFSTEQVTRAVATSRIPTIVAIGHEVDVSLAELAADQRASTPSNAAELLVPDRRQALAGLGQVRQQLGRAAQQAVQDARGAVRQALQFASQAAAHSLQTAGRQLALQQQLLQAFDPQAALQRGYALVRRGAELVTSGVDVHTGDELAITLRDANVTAAVKRVIMKKS
ncbi:MAG TPA: exodeoxyribonuclease VII large subunit [Candidatus Saccharimonadales bacterium]|nr:exodeoxyribonuclease VII large subunit [Candidatus Saccharimonadales bacterium]